MAYLGYPGRGGPDSNVVYRTRPARDGRGKVQHQPCTVGMALLRLWVPGALAGPASSFNPYEPVLVVTSVWQAVHATGITSDKAGSLSSVLDRALRPCHFPLLLQEPGPGVDRERRTSRGAQILDAGCPQKQRQHDGRISESRRGEGGVRISTTQRYTGCRRPPSYEPTLADWPSRLAGSSCLMRLAHPVSHMGDRQTCGGSERYIKPDSESSHGHSSPPGSIPHGRQAPGHGRETSRRSLPKDL